MHSLHRRRPLDLASHGHAVVLLVRVRRFRCMAPDRPRRAFTEPLPPETVIGSGRRTARLDGLVRYLGVALGGRPGSALARRRLPPVGKDTVLRVMRHYRPPETAAAGVVGIDERAWRRRRRCGTIICDLERRRVLDLLPDREPSTVKAWLSAHPGFRVVARDRAWGFADAAAEVAPQAVQVADRWHLMENANAAFLEAVRSVLGPIRRALGAGIVDPGLLSAAERIQYEGFLRRREENSAVRAMAGAGTAINRRQTAPTSPNSWYAAIHLGRRRTARSAAISLPFDNAGDAAVGAVATALAFTLPETRTSGRTVKPSRQSFWNRPSERTPR